MSIRVAVVGCGHLGKIHARLINQNPAAELVAVVDPVEHARQQVANEQGCQAIADWEDAARMVDAAIIATPTQTHHEIAAGMIARGVHTLIEKPVTQTTDQARHLKLMADATGCKVLVGHVERFNAAFQTARSLVTGCKFVQASRCSGYTFRSTDVGVVMDLMIHDIDLVCQLTQGRLVDVQAIGFSLLGQHEDLANARLEFSDGMVAVLNAARTSPVAMRQFDIYGTSGVARLDMAGSQLQWVSLPRILRERQLQLGNMTEEQVDAVRNRLFEDLLPIQQIDVQPVNAIQAEHDNWLTAIRDEGTAAVDLGDGLKAVDIATQIVDAIRQHRWTEKSGANRDQSSVPAGPLASLAEIDNAQTAIGRPESRPATRRAA